MQAKSINSVFMIYDGGMKAGRPTKSNRSDFAKRLRDLRLAAGLSQTQVAEQLGISQPSYADWERRNVALRPEQLEALSKTLGVTIADLFPQLASRRTGPIGKARERFKVISGMPRSQQRKILEVVDGLLAQAKGAQ